MKTRLFILPLACLLTVLLIYGCGKEFLEQKPEESILVPRSLSDLQALLDNDAIMNIAPSLGVLAADDYYLQPAVWATLSPIERNGYIWKKENPWEGARLSDWNMPYQQIFYANVVLDELSRHPDRNTKEGRAIRSAALFFRGTAYFNLAQLFAPQPTLANRAEPWGLPLRLSPEIDQQLRRSTIGETYDRILSDLKGAAAALPLQVATPYRPSRVAALAMLARVNLVWGDHASAGAYADSALAIKPALLDYNTLNQTAARPISIANPELIHVSRLVQRTFLRSMVPDTILMGSYGQGDLRPRIFFNAAGSFKAAYTGTVSGFGGLATDELYLIRAESRARAGDINGGLADVNALLVKRYRNGTFVYRNAATADELLALVIAERRRELYQRGLAWTDLRRLNADVRFSRTISRRLGADLYSMASGDLRYTFPIPDEEIGLSGIPQNPR